MDKNTTPSDGDRRDSPLDPEARKPLGEDAAPPEGDDQDRSSDPESDSQLGENIAPSEGEPEDPLIAPETEPQPDEYVEPPDDSDDREPPEHRGDEQRNGRRRRRMPFLAILLIVIGAVFLMHTTDVLPWSIWLEMWRFWSVLLIAIGVNLIVGSRAPIVAAVLFFALFVGSVGAAYAMTESGGGGHLVSTFSESLSDVERADLEISFGAGTLELTSLPAGSPSLVEASFFGRRAETTVSRSGDKADIGFAMDRWGLFHGATDVLWEVAMSESTRLTLDVEGGAAKMVLDLRRLQVSNLDINVGAAEVRVVLPEAAGIVDVDLGGGAASINVVVPEGVAARIVKSSGFTIVDIDTARFPKFGDVYESPGYAAAENRVDLTISIGAAQVTVR